jgi:hypothetical protein
VPITILLADGERFQPKETTTMSIGDHDRHLGPYVQDPKLLQDRLRYNSNVADVADHAPAGPPRDPLADAVRALKTAELALELNLAGVKERRAEIKERKKEVARAYLEALSRKPRSRKAAAK